MKLNKSLLIAILFLSVFQSFSQNKKVGLLNPIPGNIKLLSGYTHKAEQGIDTRVGKIFKENGLEIEYDIGDLAGNYALGAYTREKEKLFWFKSQKANDYEVFITYLKDGRIYATFPKNDANFIAIIKTNEDLADFLIMIMTYGSNNETENKKRDKK